MCPGRLQSATLLAVLRTIQSPNLLDDSFLRLLAHHETASCRLLDEAGTRPGPPTLTRLPNIKLSVQEPISFKVGHTHIRSCKAGPNNLANEQP